MVKKHQRQPVIRLICVYTVFLLPDAVNGFRRHNDGRQAMIETIPGQDTTSPSGEWSMRPAVDNSSALYSGSFHGVFANVGSMQSSTGALINFPACEGSDEEFLKTKPEDNWIAVLYYPTPCQQNETTANCLECLHVLERGVPFGPDFVERTEGLPMSFLNETKLMDSGNMTTNLSKQLSEYRIEVKNAMLFGASAIFILTVNSSILQELDSAQLFSHPVVIVQEISNITLLLKVAKSALNPKIRVKVTYSSSFCAKANPSLFWIYFFSALAVIMLLLLIKTGRRWLEAPEENWEDESIEAAAWQGLSFMKIKRYRKSGYTFDDRDRDTCAVCLEQFYKRQKIRILPCSHEFHTKCIDPWLVRRPNCPLCNVNVLENKPDGKSLQ